MVLSDLHERLHRLLACVLLTLTDRDGFGTAHSMWLGQVHLVHLVVALHRGLKWVKCDCHCQQVTLSLSTGRLEQTGFGFGRILLGSGIDFTGERDEDVSSLSEQVQSKISIKGREYFRASCTAVT